MGETDWDALCLSREPDHPVHGGETPCRRIPRRASTEHPRTWGKTETSSARLPVSTDHPVHGGKTLTCRIRRSREPDHPHTWGKDDAVTTRRARYDGPSRVWGRDALSGPLDLVLARTIPVHGERRLYGGRGQPPGRSADHPRVRGETPPLWWTSPPPSEHPRVRGRDVRTMACPTGRTEHPEYGERRSFNEMSNRLRKEHPPNTGERRICVPHGVVLLRTIPSTGERLQGLGACEPCGPDHPRVRGRDATSLTLTWLQRGSSPYMGERPQM